MRGCTPLVVSPDGEGGGEPDADFPANSGSQETHQDIGESPPGTAARAS